MARVLTDGYIHGRVTVALAAVSLVPASVAMATSHSPYPYLVTFGILAGLILDPDLDQFAVTSSEWRVKRVAANVPILGVLVAGLWVGWWFVYAAVFNSGANKSWPKALRLTHRGLSHTPILGTLTRILWLLPAYLLLHNVLGFTITPEHAIMLACGLSIADIGHWLRDFHGLSV